MLAQTNAMSFKKIIEPLKDNLQKNGITEPNPLQTEILSKIKGGKSMFVIAPKNAGKTTSIIISVINKLKEAFEDAPRALIFVKDKEEALKLEAIFNIYKKSTHNSFATISVILGDNTVDDKLILVHPQ